MTLVWMIVVVALGLVAYGFVCSLCVIGVRDDARVDELLDEEENRRRRLGSSHVIGEQLQHEMSSGAAELDWLGTAAAAARSAALKLERARGRLTDDVDAGFHDALNDLDEASESAALVRERIADPVSGGAS